DLRVVEPLAPGIAPDELGAAPRRGPADGSGRHTDVRPVEVVEELFEEAVHRCGSCPIHAGLLNRFGSRCSKSSLRSLPGPAREPDLVRHAATRQHRHPMPAQHEGAHAKPFTQEQFRAWLDERPSSDLGHDELLDGRIVVSPPAGWPHPTRLRGVHERRRRAQLDGRARRPAVASRPACSVSAARGARCGEPPEG
ncbi:hypothetical protein K2Z84_33415, partial [Candidatus Binatia bacterium]|nr:hypothetical protein [Candidatus Binatia bacterium]